MNQNHRYDTTTLAQDLRPFLFSMAQGAIGLQRVILLDISASETKLYLPNASGLNQAISAADAGDLIILPSARIIGNFTVPIDVEMTGLGMAHSIIQGKVTLSPGSILSSIGVENITSSSGNVIGVQGPGAGTAYVKNCSVVAIQSGCGNYWAVGAYEGDGELIISDTALIGQSYFGLGYAASAGAPS